MGLKQPEHTCYANLYKWNLVRYDNNLVNVITTGTDICLFFLNNCILPEIYCLILSAVVCLYLKIRGWTNVTIVCCCILFR